MFLHLIFSGVLFDFDFEIVKLMQKISGDEPQLWGTAIIGFGNVLLKYESGRELDWFKFGFSPRKQNIVLYGVANPEKQKEEFYTHVP